MRCRSISTTAFLTGFIACCWPIDILVGAQPMDPTGTPIEPVEFPDEIPTEPVETPTQLSPMEATESAEIVEPEVPEPTAPQPVATWRLFTSEDDSFRVAMPSPPARYSFAAASESDQAFDERSRMYMQMQLVDASHLEIYAAAFVESAGFNAADNMDSAVMDCALSLGNVAQLNESRTLTSGAHRGAEASFIKPDNGLQVSRCYIVGDRAYMLTATREPFDAGAGLQPITINGSPLGSNTEAPSQDLPRQQSPSMEAFFGSFEILSGR